MGRLSKDIINNYKLLFYQEKGTNLMPFLIKKYKDSKPMQIALMVFALIDLGIINKVVIENQTNLGQKIC